MSKYINHNPMFWDAYNNEVDRLKKVELAERDAVQEAIEHLDELNLRYIMGPRTDELLEYVNQKETQNPTKMSEADNIDDDVDMDDSCSPDCPGCLADKASLDTLEPFPLKVSNSKKEVSAAKLTKAIRAVSELTTTLELNSDDEGTINLCEEVIAAFRLHGRCHDECKGGGCGACDTDRSVGAVLCYSCSENSALVDSTNVVTLEMDYSLCLPCAVRLPSMDYRLFVVATKNNLL